MLNLEATMISLKNSALTHASHSQDEMPKKEKGAAAAPVSAQLPTHAAHTRIQKNTHAWAHTIGKVTISLIVINYRQVKKLAQQK